MTQKLPVRVRTPCVQGLLGGFVWGARWTFFRQSVAPSLTNSGLIVAKAENGA
jgi:hypothetical protein